jgi:hypothetical protein
LWRCPCAISCVAVGQSPECGSIVFEKQADAEFLDELGRPRWARPALLLLLINDYLDIFDGTYRIAGRHVSVSENTDPGIGFGASTSNSEGSIVGVDCATALALIGVLLQLHSLACSKVICIPAWCQHLQCEKSQR